MLRLVIVDDEKIIRETISTIIDCNSLDIEVIGTCKNGIEAYDMILDEYPDIVLTDIKMPGLSGLELIEKIRQTDEDIKFVILSGYGEFDYAKTAMKYGVKHYLLKPCNENQIIDVMKQVAQDCYRTRALQEMQNKHQKLIANLQENIMRNIIMEGLTPKDNLRNILSQYEHYIDFLNIDYDLCYVYYLEENNLEECVNKIRSFLSVSYPSVIPFFIYTRNTLILFFKGLNDFYDPLDNFLKNLHFNHQTVSIEYERKHFPNLQNLLEVLFKKINRYEYVYLINNHHIITAYNHSSLFIYIDDILNKFSSQGNFDKEKIIEELSEILSQIEDVDLLKAVITTFLMKLVNHNFIFYNPIHVTDFLIEINDINHCKTILQIFLNKFSNHMASNPATHYRHKDFIEKTLMYVNEHLSDPNLSLKWIAENYLFMNVDYLSKQFIKQTGYKFSQYLTNLRIERAKKLLLECNTEKIYTIAEQIGCGNNPQYFSQIFKKYTGMTPTEYIKKANGGNENESK